MQDDFNSLSEFIQSLGVVGGFILATLAYLIPQLRRVPRRIEEWFIERREERLARIAREKRIDEVLGFLPEMSAEFKPNGGNSMRDKINRAVELAEAGVTTAAQVKADLERHLQNQGDVSKDLTEHREVTEVEHENRH